jgi:acyl dehydratase
MGHQDKIGLSHSSDEIAIDRDAIEKFARGIADPDPSYTSGASDCAAPPLIVARSVIPTTGAMLGQVELDLNLTRIVHGSIELRFHRRVVVGDSIATTAVFRGVEEKSSGSVVIFDFEVKDQDGQLVSDGVTRYFVRGERKGAKKASTPSSDPGAPDHEHTEVVPDGQSLAYAEGSGDVFPIHTSRSFAQSVGLPDVIVHGMCTLAFAARAVVDSLGEGDAGRLSELSVRFSKMVFHGDELTTQIWKREAADGTTHARFVTSNQRGQQVLLEGRACVR